MLFRSKSEITLPSNTYCVLDHLESGWRSTIWIDFGDNIKLPFHFEKDGYIALLLTIEETVLVNNIEYKIVSNRKPNYLSLREQYCYLLMDPIKSIDKVIEDKKTVKGKVIGK